MSIPETTVVVMDITVNGLRVVINQKTELNEEAQEAKYYTVLGLVETWKTDAKPPELDLALKHYGRFGNVDDAKIFAGALLKMQEEKNAKAD